MSCHRHPDVPATAACGNCLQPICGACSVFEGGKDRCPECVTRYWRARRVRTGVLAALGLAGLALGGALLLGQVRVSVSTSSGETPAFDYGRDAGRVARMRQALEREPCNRTLASEHLQLLMSLQDVRGAAAAGDAFIARCGKAPGIRALTYAAHMQLSEHALAVRDATELLDAMPNKTTYRIWRAQAHDAAGSHEAALADYQLAFEQQPEQRQLAVWLADSLERQFRPCDAALVLQRHAAEARRARDPELHLREEALVKVGDCHEGRGRAVLAMPRSGSIWADVRVNDKARGRFIVDTGATEVAISPAFAERLGLNPKGARPVLVATANGFTVAALVRVKSVELQSARAENLHVAVTPGLPPGVDGLLGMTFLSRFQMHADARAGLMELTARERRPAAHGPIAR
ncbi:MAG: TIGR02281 family clan AA aspartic protease [Myxococcaceae bacterium]|nr:TIGR02281 family clan AA aspartic protease [Myxococcaceae bacterium]